MNREGDEDRVGIASAGTLPKGRTTLRLLLDPAFLADAAAAKKELAFRPSLNCQGAPSADLPRQVVVPFDPARFEPPPSALRVNIINSPVIAYAGYRGLGMIGVINRRGGTVTFSVGEEPPGFQQLRATPTRRSDGDRDSADVTFQVAPGTTLGRHFIPVKAMAGAETAVTYLVVDVTATPR